MDNITQYNIEAEQSVLGAVLIDSTVVFKVGNIVSPEDFSRGEHMLIMRAAYELAKMALPTDIITVSDQLKKGGRLEGVGGIAYLAKLADAVPNSVNADYYAKIVKEKSLCRQAISIGKEIELLASDGNLADARAKAEALEMLTLKNDVTFSNMFTQEDFERLSKSKRFYSKHLNTLTSRIPFIRGECIYIAGRTSTGKTQMAINMTIDFLIQGAKVGYVSCEMGKEQVMIRLLNWEFGFDIPMYEIDIRKEEWWEAGQALLKQDRFSNFYFFEKSSDFSDIVGWINAHDFDVVFIDYIQLLRDRNYSKLGRNAEIGAIARRIRQEISKKRCVIVMSQMNRTKPEDADLAQIRDSGEIEQTSTGIVFIDRKDEPGLTTFKYRIMKNQTYGSLSGWIDLDFKRNGEFKEVA